MSKHTQIYSVLFGGVSFEHEISIVSAISMKKVLGDAISHFFFIDSAHTLYIIPHDAMQAKTFALGAYKRYKKAEFMLGGVGIRGVLGGIKPISNLGVMLSMVHGGDGEDGVLSSMLDFYKIPYIAPRAQACILSHSKVMTKIYASHCGVKTLPYITLSRNIRKIRRAQAEQNASQPRAIAQNHQAQLTHALSMQASAKYNATHTIRLDDYPYIIKPARLGSSIGVSVAMQESELDYALDSAFSYDTEVIIEPFFHGVKEYNLAGYKNAHDEIVFSIIEEPQKSNLLSFDDKYLDFSRDSMSNEASISSELKARLYEAFRRIYGDVFEGALIRCDFFLIDDEIYLNEINPIPGSLAQYLFDDFPMHIHALSRALPISKPINITYHYVEQIRATKGK